jgi:hypothetical protein
MNMSLNKKQKTFLEALDTYLNQDAQLGLKDHEKNKLNDLESVDSLEYNRNDVYAKYRDRLLKANIIFIGPIMRAFNSAHNIRIFGSPTFLSAMERELKAQPIASSEVEKALDLADKLSEELKKSKDQNEQDSGLNSDMEGIKDVSQPEQASEFDIIKTDLNKKNVKDINDEFE